MLHGARETAERIRVAGAVGSTWTPHGARLHPAKLVQGLARAVEALGVDDPRVDAGHRDPARSTRSRPYGTVRAPYVLRCTEGFTAGLKGARRTWLPMNSSMIATEPLPDAVWDAIGWQGCETLGDMAHAYMYAQRTADGRIALGGRGVPYRYGSKHRQRRAHAARDRRRAARHPGALLPGHGGGRGSTTPGPACSAYRATGAPRSPWTASTGLGWAGGYVGSGVATTNLAGRTLRDLVLQDSGQAGPTDLTTLPWVNHKVRKWEPEPLRWLGVQGMYAAYREADRRESRGHSADTHAIARAANRITGH